MEQGPLFFVTEVAPTCVRSNGLLKYARKGIERMNATLLRCLQLPRPQTDEE